MLALNCPGKNEILSFNLYGRRQNVICLLNDVTCEKSYAHKLNTKYPSLKLTRKGTQMINSDLIQTLVIDRPNLRMNNRKKLSAEIHSGNLQKL